MRTLTVENGPFKGKELVEAIGQPASESAIAYVKKGKGKYVLAIWLDGQWVGRHLKPLDFSVESYFELRGFDGSSSL